MLIQLCSIHIIAQTEPFVNPFSKKSAKKANGHMPSAFFKVYQILLGLKSKLNTGLWDPRLSLVNVDRIAANMARDRRLRRHLTTMRMR